MLFRRLAVAVGYGAAGDTPAGDVPAATPEPTGGPEGGPGAAEGGRRPRRGWRGAVLAVLSAVGTLVAAHLLLLAPTAEVQCARPVHLNVNPAMSYMLNCDSRMFMVLAHRPQLILQPRSDRQSRPGYVALSVAATGLLGEAANSSGLTRRYGQRDSAYLPLVLINYLALAAAVGIAAALLRDLGVPAVGVAALSAVMAVNDVTKAFFWTPHQQMFTLLVPVVTVVILRWLMRRTVTRAEITLLGLGLGAAMLVYGSVVITVAAISLVLIGGGLRRPAGTRRLAVAWRNLVLVVLLGAGFATPQLAWMGVCRLVAGSFYSHETAKYHQFVWLSEAALRGRSALASTIKSFTYLTAWEIVVAVGALLVVGGAAVAMARLARVTLAPASREDRLTLAATGITIGCSVVFLWALGYYQPRIAFHLAPPLLLLIGWAGARIAARSRAWATGVKLALPVLAVAWVGYELTRHGPYS